MVGIQSAVIRDIDGNVPAWNAPKRNRSSTRKPNDQRRRSAAGTRPGPGTPSVIEPPRMMAARDVPHAEPVAEEAPGHLEQAVADHERRHHLTEVLVGEPQRLLELGRGRRETNAVDDR